MQIAVFAPGLTIGEEAKGATVEWLAKVFNAHTIIRKGGWQAGHFVVLEDGREQAFSHYGAGTFFGVKTFLVNMVISPMHLFKEATELSDKGVPDPLGLMTIHQDCLATTPFHGAMSRLREIMRGANRKGTIGTGAGETVRDSKEFPELAIHAGDFRNFEVLYRKVEGVRQLKLDQAAQLTKALEGTLPTEAEQEIAMLQDTELTEITAKSFWYLADLVQIVGNDYFERLLSLPGTIVCESSHGALLHPRYGFIPHVTQVDPTQEDILALLRHYNYQGQIIKFGVARCYMTRHGAGPLVTYDPEMTRSIQETHNSGGSDWLGEFRNGQFDMVALRYAIGISGGKQSFDGFALSYLDVLNRHKEWQICEAYKFEGYVEDLDEFFVLDGDKITAIKVHPDSLDEAHLEHQHRLTQLLKDCRPILRTLTGDTTISLEQVFLDTVEEQLGIPVVAVSYGPTAKDRQVVPQWTHLFI